MRNGVSFSWDFAVPASNCRLGIAESLGIVFGDLPRMSGGLLDCRQEVEPKRTSKTLRLLTPVHCELRHLEENTWRPI